MAKKVRIVQIRSRSGQSKRQLGHLDALGLKKIRDMVERVDSPALRGVLLKVSHLVTVQEL